MITKLFPKYETLSKMLNSSILKSSAKPVVILILVFDFSNNKIDKWHMSHSEVSATSYTTPTIDYLYH